ncbi:MAG: Calx-beta domain-containing protein [Caldilineaceae bacterium]
MSIGVCRSPFVRLNLRFYICLVLGPLLAILALFPRSAAKAAEPVEAGYRDFAYPAQLGGNSRPTAEKAESKLWWNDGAWWGILWDSTPSSWGYKIYRLNNATQNWEPTNVVVDLRNTTKADTLWDNTAKKLYIVSHVYSGIHASNQTTTDTNLHAKLSRFSYNAGIYTLDPGFPVDVNNNTSETAVIAKDGAGVLWVTYVLGVKDVTKTTYSVWVNRSNDNGVTWGQPYILPAPDAVGVNADDISAVIAYNGYVGVMWSDQNSKKLYFATHANGAGDTASDWQATAITTPLVDDHMNLKAMQADPAGNVFAIIKTAATSPKIALLVCKNNCAVATNWSLYPVWSGSDYISRPGILIDAQNRKIYAFAEYPYTLTAAQMASPQLAPEGVVTNATGIPPTGIYYKVSDLDNISFPVGEGLPLIKSATDQYANDPTSTKQNLNGATGLVVLAGDYLSTRYYLHNCLALTNPLSSCDNPLQPSVSFSNATYSVNENAGTANITVQLNAAPSQAVTVAYATSNGTASANQDYTPSQGTLTFAPGEMSKTFAVPIVNDQLNETAETINLVLSNPSNATLGSASAATLAIVDDDPLPTVQFAQAAYSANENNAGGNATMLVTLNAASGMTVTVNYATTTGTATAGSDYTATSGALTFRPGEVSKSFTATLLDDSLDEADETVGLRLSNPSNATLGTPTNATLTIVDDDPSPSVQFSTAAFAVNENVTSGKATITVTLSAPSAKQVSVSYATDNGTALAELDYTSTSGALVFNPGETSKTFAVQITNDNVVEPNETVNLTLSNPANATLGAIATATLTLINDDRTVAFASANYGVGAKTSAATITVTLSSASNTPVNVNYATSDGTAIAGKEYKASSGTLTFAPGQTSQSFSVPILIAELNGKTIHLTLSKPVNAALGAPASAILILGLPEIYFSKPDYRVNEGAGTAIVTATLTAAANAVVTVQYATSDGSAIVGNDYTAATGVLTFAPGETNKTFLIPILQDPLDEPDETLLLKLSNPSNANLGAPNTATLVIIDDDVPPVVQFSAAVYTESVGAQGGVVNLDVTLSAASAKPITVTYTTSAGVMAGSEAIQPNGVLLFAPGETKKTISIQLLPDDVVQGQSTISLRLSNSINAALGAADATVMVVRDQHRLFLPLVVNNS